MKRGGRRGTIGPASFTENKTLANAERRLGCTHCVERSVSAFPLPNSELSLEGGQFPSRARSRLWEREAGGLGIWGTPGGTGPLAPANSGSGE